MGMKPAELIAAACEKTGLEDFGGESFREGLEVYCQSASSEAQLNEFGQAAVPGAILSALVNRLRVMDWLKRHPEISDERIDAPFVVVGLFRSKEFGQAAVPGAILSALVNRLRVMDWLKRHPEISDERIDAPFVVVGLF